MGPNRLFLTTFLTVLVTSAKASGPFLVPASSIQPCLSTPAPADQIFNLSALYAQFDTGQTGEGEEGEGAKAGSGNGLLNNFLGGNGVSQGFDLLKLVWVGEVGSAAQGSSNTTGFSSTLIATTSILNFQQYQGFSALCDSIRNPNSPAGNGSGCPYGPGPFSFNTTIPLSHPYPLTQLKTRIRVLDPSSPPLELACVDVLLTPYYPSSFPYTLFLWIPAGVCLAYLALYVIARAWGSYQSVLLDREAAVASSLTVRLAPEGGWIDRVKRTGGEVWWKAWSGKIWVGGASPSALRFVTPGVREWVWQTQYAASLGMIAVKWPNFAYPIFSKAAWSTLVYNVTLTQGADADFKRPSTLYTPDFPNMSNPDVSVFSSQLVNENSILYLDPTLGNVLLNLNHSDKGLESFATAVGLRPQDLWPISTVMFLIIVGSVIIISGLWAGGDGLLSLFAETGRGSEKRLGRKNVNGNGNGNGKESLDTSYEATEDDEAYANETGNLKSKRQGEEGPKPIQSWWAGITLNQGDETDASRRERATYHFNLLKGNLLRILILFHFPLTIFAFYQLYLSTSRASVVSSVLAALFLVFVLIAVPAFTLFLVHRASLVKLAEHMPTLLSLGPLYNTFAEEMSMFMSVRFLGTFIVAVVIGLGQGSGTAQSIVILLVEIVDTLATSLWLPWGDGAAMGPLAFIMSVSRIITAVLLVILSPAVNIGDIAAGWITYVILLIQAIIFALAIFIFFVKVIEMLIRILGRVPFDESRSVRAGGLAGAIRRWDLGGGKSTTRHRRGAAAAAAAKRRRRRSASTVVSSPDKRRTGSRTSTEALNRPSSAGSEARMIDASSRNRTSSQGSASMFRPQPSPSMQPLNGASEDLDEGYIMSAMSTPGWTASVPAPHGQNYIAPGSYSAGPAQHRSTQSWSAGPDGVRRAPPASGFSVVRGGKATEDAPWMLASPELAGRVAEFRKQSAATKSDSGYPPSIHRSTNSGGGGGGDYFNNPAAGASTASSIGRPRAQSQSATIEMFNVLEAMGISTASQPNSSSPPAQNATAASTRRLSRPSPPLQADLLSNAPPRSQPTAPGSMTTAIPLSAGDEIAATKKKRRASSNTGIFGTFGRKRKGKGRSDDSSEDDDDDDDDDDDVDDVDNVGVSDGLKNRRRNLWPFGRKKGEGSANRDDVDEEEAAGTAGSSGPAEQPSGGRSFVVVRPPPRTGPTPSAH